MSDDQTRQPALNLALLSTALSMGSKLEIDEAIYKTIDTSADLSTWPDEAKADLYASVVEAISDHPTVGELVTVFSKAIEAVFKFKRTA